MPTASPLVTHFIPSFNHAGYIEKAVESVLYQTYQNSELIVIDDGSTDDSAKVLAQFKDAPRVTVVLNQENRGQSAVFNQAISMAKGEFIAYLPSDDWHLPRKTQIQVERFLQLPDSVGVVYGRGARFFEDTGETRDVNLPLHRGHVLRQLIRYGNFVYPASPMFRKACFEKVKLDESYRAEGEAIYLKLAMHFEFDYVDEVVAVMRDHSYNTGKDVRMMYQDNLRYWEAFFSRPDLSHDLRKLAPKRLGSLHRTKGLQLLKKLGDAPAARSALWKAIKTYPLYVTDYRVVGGLAVSILPSAMRTRLLGR